MGARRVVFHRRNADPVQTFSVGNLVFLHLNLSRLMPRDQRRRQCQPRNAVEDASKQVPRHRHFGELKRHVLRVPGDLRSDLDELLS